jgi:hypothetical protein
MYATSAVKVPIAIRSDKKLTAAFEKRVRTQLSRRIGPTSSVQRATVRFEDVNGPKGGVDTACRIKLVISGRPTVLVEKRGTSEPLAFADAVLSVGTSLMRDAKKQKMQATRVARRPRSLVGLEDQSERGRRDRSR